MRGAIAPHPVTPPIGRSAPAMTARGRPVRERCVTGETAVSQSKTDLVGFSGPTYAADGRTADAWPPTPRAHRAPRTERSRTMTTTHVGPVLRSCRACCQTR
ncbi:hypothetical protein CBZ_29500 [Cellulomonas biazotea]|uniref:Uncharacterized protein n=1 Tax=Cellulomonas biazotea TaxID=1709 RepID=A0A402DUU5_9CELL|nr:hypothetical protein CBZ_29500 [Cellulomonas biazotea]